MKRVQKRLEDELYRLKIAFGLDPCLSVTWTPSTDGSLSGEVKGKSIRIYELEEEKAIHTLRHEVIDCLISDVIEPYKKVTNGLIKVINDEAYRRKERFIEFLLKEMKMNTDK